MYPSARMSNPPELAEKHHLSAIDAWIAPDLCLVLPSLLRNLLNEPTPQFARGHLRTTTPLAVVVKLEVRWNQPNAPHVSVGDKNRGHKTFEGAALSQQPRSTFGLRLLQLVRACVGCQPK